MRKLIDIIEGLKIGSKTKIITYSCKPKTREELKNIIKERFKKDKDTNLNDIDVSYITDMESLFYELDPHNIDISMWDVSNVKDMFGMFYECRNFNCDLSKWNVSRVTNMQGMFYDCNNFNSDLSNWDVSNVKYIGKMFVGCTSLKNKPIWYKK